MKKKITKEIWAMSLLISLFVSCSDEDVPLSVVQRFEEVQLSLTSTTPAVTVTETEGLIQTFEFALDAAQNTPAIINIGVGNSSTAVEGVDFTLSTHSVSFAAFGGQDGFSVDVTLHQDFDPNEDDKTVWLEFSSNGLNGIATTEVQVLTIQESGTVPPPSPTIDFTLSWEFDDPLIAAEDVCNIVDDLDLVIYDSGGGPYTAGELLGFGAASTACPEQATLTVSNMNDGEVYNVWIVMWAGADYGDASALTAHIDFERANTTFNGRASFTGTLLSTMSGVGFIPFTIERNGDIVTLKDASTGEGIGSGRSETTGEGLTPFDKIMPK